MTLMVELPLCTLLNQVFTYEIVVRPTIIYRFCFEGYYKGFQGIVYCIRDNLELDAGFSFDKERLVASVF